MKQKKTILIKYLFFKEIAFLMLFFIIGCAPSKIKSVAYNDTQLTDSLNYQSSEIAAIITPYKTALDKKMNEVLNTSTTEMMKDLPEGLLGNFVADLSLAVTHQVFVPANDKLTDFCILNNGGLRTSLPKGAITRGKLFELMPFENELAVVTLSGEKTQELFDYIAEKGGIPISGNVKIEIKNKKAVHITINNFPFDSTRIYRVVTSDYLAFGGDKMTFFEAPLAFEKVNIKLRDAIIKHTIDEKKKGKPITSQLDQRITNIE